MSPDRDAGAGRRSGSNWPPVRTRFGGPTRPIRDERQAPALPDLERRWCRAGPARVALATARPSSSSNRSAAAYGSRRCSATSSRRASVGARVRRRRGAAPADGPRRSPRPAPRHAPVARADDSPTRPTVRWRSSAASSSGTPSPVAAVVIRTSGRFGRGRVVTARRAARTRPASPGVARRSAARRACRPC